MWGSERRALVQFQWIDLDKVSGLPLARDFVWQVPAYGRAVRIAMGLSGPNGLSGG
jgi:hypothetical protein